MNRQQQVLVDPTEELADRVAATLSGLPLDADVDAILAMAKTRIVMPYTSADLEQIFDGQLATLQGRECPAVILDGFRGMKKTVLDAALATRFRRGRARSPFAPVITPNRMGIDDQMAMVVHQGAKGYTYLDTSAITNVAEVPSDLHYILDIEDGEEFLNTPPENAQAAIVKQGRIPMYVVGGIAVATHTTVLSRHYMDLPGSRYDGAGYVPDLFLDDGEPKLGWFFAVGADPKWGAASCGRRVGG